MSSRYNYIVIGSGIAGLHASLLAKDYGSVLLLTKESIEELLKLDRLEDEDVI